MGAIVCFAVACGRPTDPDPVTLNDLAAVWNATAFDVTNNLDMSLTADAFAMGVRWRLTVSNDGLFTVDLSNPLGSDSYNGTVEIQNDSLIFIRSDIVPPRMGVHFTLDRGQLQLTSLGEEQCGSYGWRASQCPIPVTLRIRLIQGSY